VRRSSVAQSSIAGRRPVIYIRAFMIELGLLGPSVLHDSDGRDLASLLAQPKRFALLAYLVVSGRAGYVRRDSLAAMFWPELDQQAARRALRNTLYHLREALGPEVIVTRGDESVSIDAARITSDVAKLGDAQASGRDVEAVECYRGDLLAGLHFANVGEAFEDWLTAERRRINDQVLSALSRLVDGEERAHNLLAAARWAQRACELAPGDESWLRRAMALLDRAGDRGGALRLYQAIVRYLASDFGASPSEETVALAAEIRDGSRKPSGANPRLPVAEAGQPTSGSNSGTTSAGLARGRTGARWAAVLGAIAVAALLVRAASATHRHELVPTRVLIQALENRTGDTAFAPLGRMAQDWLAQGILQTHLVEVVDPRGVVVQDSSQPNPLVLARRNGAALVVTGSYSRVDDTLFLEAVVTDVRTGRVARVIGPIPSSVGSPLTGLGVLRSRVMTALATEVNRYAGQELDASAEIPPYDVYQQYIEGRDAYWHGDGRRAEALFLEAAGRDSAFTAAAIGAMGVAANYNDCALVDSLGQALSARAQTLDRMDRLSLDIAAARCDGRNEEMLRLTLERARLAPRTSELQMAAAAAALWANRPQQALEVLDRLDPATDLGWSSDTTHFDYWSAMTEALHLLGRHDQELAVATRAPRSAPLTRAWLRGRALVALSRRSAALALLDSTLSLPVETSNRTGLAPFTNGRPQYDATPAWIACWIAREFAVHGDSEGSREAATRAWDWYRNRPPEERGGFEERLVAVWSLELLGIVPEAESLTRRLLAADSDNVDARGELAELAAERGDTALADSLDGWLAAQSVTRVNWSAGLYRADVAARLGRPDAAFARMVEAWNEGAWPMWIHQDPALATLRTRKDFVALTAPRD
jgi:DNA-binding SARP family transcriptional activator